LELVPTLSQLAVLYGLHQIVDPILSRFHPFELALDHLSEVFFSFFNEFFAQNSSASMNVRDDNCRWKEEMILYISLSFNRLLSQDAVPGRPEFDPP
jgi:hypothetical protein